MAGERANIDVRLGLDKTGFDAGLNDSIRSLKKFAGFFGVSLKLGAMLKRAAGEVMELAGEVQKLIETSNDARVVFDQMAAGVTDIGEEAGFTKDQLEKMAKAAKMFSAEDLEQLALGKKQLGAVKDSVTSGIGKLLALSVALGNSFFGGISGLLAGTSDTEGATVASDRAVSKALREEKERLKSLERQQTVREQIAKELEEEEVYFQKAAEAEQVRLDIAREQLALKIKSLELTQKEAQSRQQSQRSDRSAFSVFELASMESAASPGAAKAMLKAREIQRLEEEARMARLNEFGAQPLTARESFNAKTRAARGIKGPMSSLELTDAALAMRSELSPLSSHARNPIDSLDEINGELKALRDMASGSGLVVQPRMAK